MPRANALVSAVLAFTLWSCSAPRDGGSLVLALEMTRTEFLASGTDLGTDFLTPSHEWLKKKWQYFATTADLVSIHNPVGDELNYGRSLVQLTFKDDRLCEIVVMPEERRPCPNDGADVLRFFQRSGFRAYDGATFEAEVQREFERLVEGRREIPEWRDKDTFDVGLWRSDGHALMTFGAAFDTGKHCFNDIFEVRTCPLPR